jgi:DNA-binding NarL/FixJ family response regulator
MARKEADIRSARSKFQYQQQSNRKAAEKRSRTGNVLPFDDSQRLASAQPSSHASIENTKALAQQPVINYPEPHAGAGTLTVLVVDDHPVVREGLVSLINRQTDLRVVAEANNGLEGVQQFLAHHPDVALIDLRMPVMDGIQAVCRIHEHAPEARIVILTTYESEEDIYRAVGAGVQGYILKDSPAAEVVQCIREVGARRTWIPPAVGAQLAKRVTDRSLTPREMDVLRTLSMGKSNKEIGVAFNISEATVKVHVTHILEKLKVTGRTEAISAALKRGLIRMEGASPTH